VKHAVQRDEIQVSVLSTATFKRVKEALSAKLGRSDIMAARFVFKQAGTYVSYKDGDAIGDRRKINILGGEDLKPAPGMKPQITLEEALQMQRDLAEGFGKSEFQQKLSELESNYGQSRQFLRERQMLFLTVQKVVLPKYGFDGNPKGVYDMMQAFNAFSYNQEFNMQGGYLNALLRLDDVPPQGEQPPETGEQPPDSADASPKPQSEAVEQVSEPEDVEVTVRHAIDEDQEITITVASTANMKHVKDALASALKRPDVSSKGRLVRRVGSSGTFSSFTDKEKLGNRRNLLIAGIDNLRSAEDAMLPLEAESKKIQSTKEIELTLDQALSMQSELYKGFSDEGFQKQLKELETKHSKSSRDFVTERTQLFLSVQSVVLPKYGFEGTQKGVVLMLNAF